MTAALFALLASGCGDSKSSKSSAPTGATSAGVAAGKLRPADLTTAQQTAALKRFAAKHRPIYCGGRAKPWVAFTFDDGPGPYTKKMVRIMNKGDAPATWFLAGRNVEPFKSSMKLEQRNGPIGDHSWSHPLLTSLPAAQAKDQIVSTAKAIERAGAPRVRLFRPPYGAHDKTIDRIARDHGMVQVLWNIDSEDALGANSKAISKNVIKGLKPGSIILLHENRGQTIRAMKFTIMPHVKRKKIQLVTVPQMLAGNPPTAKQLAKGRKGCR